MSKVKKPYPGSEKAKDKGCLCPVIDNRYGKGFMLENETQFIINGLCPLHSKSEQFFTEQREKLLKQHAELNSSNELENWNIEAHTLLTFEAIRRLPESHNTENS